MDRSKVLRKHNTPRLGVFCVSSRRDRKDTFRTKLKARAQEVRKEAASPVTQELTKCTTCHWTETVAV